ncbi:MAG: IS91 family transposase, partial [Gammaproteobacteria bacterium]
MFRRHGAQYLRQRGAIPTAEELVLKALASCRTASLGGHVYACPHCDYRRQAYNSCRNRHCPKCHAAGSAEWLTQQRAHLLPVGYFHVVFTVPPAIAELAWQNKQLLYSILFRASADTLREIAADPKHLGAEIGFLTVLHTWGQNLHHHPHVHCVVPAGGLSPDQTRWIACPENFFLPVRVLSRVFRGKFLQQVREAYDRGDLSFHGNLAQHQAAAAFRQ